MYIDRQIAQKIVDRTMKIIGHNVNVMNSKGVIIGSGQVERINQLHEGALQVINAGSKIDFNADEATVFVGVKGGINLPITNEGQIIGVVGITGDPAAIRKYADLVVMTSELVLEQAMLTAQVRWDRRLQDSVILRLIDGGWKSDSLFYDRVERMNIDLRTPRVAIIVDVCSAHTQKDISITAMQGILRLLERRDHDNLLAILSPTQIIILQKIHCQDERWAYQKTKKHVQEYCEQLMALDEVEFKISLGQYFEGDEGLHRSYKSAQQVLKVGRSVLPSQQVYLSREMSVNVLIQDASHSWCASQLVDDYRVLIEKDSNGSLQKTLKVYLENNMDFSLTADALHIHRNTLRYRLDKIDLILDVDLKNFKDLLRLYIAAQIHQ